MNDFKSSRASTHFALMFFGALTLAAPRASAMAGTDQIASPGEPVPAHLGPPHAKVERGWPAGVLELVNDPLRTHGWRPWFSFEPGDQTFYEYQIRACDEVNHLLQQFAAIKAPKLQVELNPEKEPRSLRYGLSLEEGNGTAVVFSFGDQKALNSWYLRLKELSPGVRKYGLRELKEVPVAKPPTLTLYVGHEAIDLKKLNFPPAVEVLANGLGTVGDNPSDDLALKAIQDFIAQRNKGEAGNTPTNPPTGIDPE